MTWRYRPCSTGPALRTDALRCAAGVALLTGELLIRVPARENADIVQDGTGRGTHRRGDQGRQAEALGQVGRLDRVPDQPIGHPVQGRGQAAGVIEAEAV